MGKRVPKARPHTLVEEDLGGVREAVRELDYKVEALDTKIDNAVATLNTKIDTKVDNAVATLNTKIDNAVATLDTKIDTAMALLRAELVGMGKGIGKMELWIKWGVIVGVAFMTGLLVIIGIVVSKLG